MALTDTAIRKAKPGPRDYKMADGAGLYLLVTAAGGKLWRLKFRVDGKEQKLALGSYPDITLAEARKRRDEARQRLALGSNPAREKQRAKQAAKVAAGNTFEVIGQEFLDKRRREKIAPATLEKAEYHLRLLNAKLGNLPVSEITAADVLAVLRPYDSKGRHETAKRLLQLAGRVLRYAVATARLASDPTRDLKGAIIAPKFKHFAAILEPKRVGELLRAIEGHEGGGLSIYALRLAPHVFVRPGELRQAEWEEIDFEAAEWTIPAAKMKMRQPHKVPLSRQSLAILREVYEATGPAGYVFPSIRTRARPMSDGTLNAALRRLGLTNDEMTAHGFRSIASTLLNESGKWQPDAIERALAHGDKDVTRGSYNRGPYWQERVAMAQWWSDHLDTLRRGADVVPFPVRGNG